MAFDFDPFNGDLWIADVGQDRLEEINLLPSDSYTDGANFGWASMEGTLKRLGYKPDVKYHEPVHEYEHGDGRCSIIGGVVVRDGNLEGLEGSFIIVIFAMVRFGPLYSTGNSGLIMTWKLLLNSQSLSQELRMGEFTYCQRLAKFFV